MNRSVAGTATGERTGVQSLDSGVEVLDAAARRCTELRAALEAEAAAGTPASDVRRQALRTEIVALIRTADQQVEAWRAMAATARALPDLWKRLPPAAVRGPIWQSLEYAPADASARQDHLGASTFVTKGWSLYAMADYVSARRAFEEALQLASECAEAAALLAWAEVALGRDDDALLTASHIVSGRPQSGVVSLARVAVGRVCLKKGILGEAVEHLARVLRDDDDRRATLYATFTLGLAHRERGMHDDAIAFFERALQRGANLVEARYELGCTHWRAGDTELAQTAWRAGAQGIGPWATRCAARLGTPGALDEGTPVGGSG